jgi:hypothetical protein
MARMSSLDKMSYAQLATLRTRVDGLLVKKQSAERAALRQKMAEIKSFLQDLDDAARRFLEGTAGAWIFLPLLHVTGPDLTTTSATDLAKTFWHHSQLGGAEAHRLLVGLFRDIVGNPFRPVAVDPAWLQWNDGTVVKMAQAMYKENRFDDLPFLADAGDLGQRRTALHERLDVGAQLADGTRRIPVSTHTERVRALDVEQIGDLVEDRLDRSVVAGDGFTPPP